VSCRHFIMQYSEVPQLGVQYPTVYCPGQTVKFGLLLWCTHPAALEALSHPDSFEVDYLHVDMFGLDVLDPHNSLRKNRYTTRLGEPGRVWRTDDDELASGVTNDVKVSKARKTEKPASKPLHQGYHTPMRLSGLAPARMSELYKEVDVTQPLNSPYPFVFRPPL
jgi:hypothetical protein